MILFSISPFSSHIMSNNLFFVSYLFKFGPQDYNVTTNGESNTVRKEDEHFVTCRRLHLLAGGRPADAVTTVATLPHNEPEPVESSLSPYAVTTVPNESEPISSPYAVAFAAALTAFRSNEQVKPAVAAANYPPSVDPIDPGMTFAEV